jgi:hypothetical protein
MFYSEYETEVNILIFYFLPEPTIHGGIKVGFQFAAMLSELGLEIVVVTPNGAAPQWFTTRVPVTRREKVVSMLSPKDRVIFSLPQDYEILKELPAKSIFHCQGTDPAIIPVLMDQEVEILTCWTQANDFASKFSRDSVDVGISISSEFFYSGKIKTSQSFATMPRRGNLPFPEKLKPFNEYRIDRMNESMTAKILQKASGFLALSENEWFGLPALEAMAAGCIVVSPSTVGGNEYLISGENCFIESSENLSTRMVEVLNSEEKFDYLRLAAMKISYNYHPASHFRKLQNQIKEGKLKFLN